MTSNNSLITLPKVGKSKTDVRKVVKVVMPV